MSSLLSFCVINRSMLVQWLRGRSRMLLTGLGFLVGILAMIWGLSVPLADAHGQDHASPPRPAIGGNQVMRPLSMPVSFQVSPEPTSPWQTCPTGGTNHIVQAGETVSSIASQAAISVTTLITANHLSQPDRLQIGQQLCVPASGEEGTTAASPSPNTDTSPAPGQSAESMGPDATPSPETGMPPATGQANLFPVGQCTWWADERYFRLHGIYVPWAINSDAWQWKARARDFGWQVSTIPTVGAIINLQPGIQGAGSLGHVAVVEQVLSNGDVLTSNLNWGSMPSQVTSVQFTPGPGVTFLTIS